MTAKREGSERRTRRPTPKVGRLRTRRERALNSGKLPGRRRVEAKRATREILLEAGLDEVIEHGLDAGLEGICARAGYTRGAFYVHFKNREEFLLALSEKVLNAIIETVLDVQAEGGVAGTIRHFSETLEAGVWPLVPKICIAMVRLMDATERWPAIRVAFDRFLTVAVERLTFMASQDQAAGHMRRDIETRELATLLVTSAVGAITLVGTSVRPAREGQRVVLLAIIRSAEDGVKA